MNAHHVNELVCIAYWIGWVGGFVAGAAIVALIFVPVYLIVVGVCGQLSIARERRITNDAAFKAITSRGNSMRSLMFCFIVVVSFIAGSVGGKAIVEEKQPPALCKCDLAGGCCCDNCQCDVHAHADK